MYRIIVSNCDGDRYFLYEGKGANHDIYTTAKIEQCAYITSKRSCIDIIDRMYQFYDNKGMEDYVCRYEEV